MYLSPSADQLPHARLTIGGSPIVRTTQAFWMKFPSLYRSMTYQPTPAISDFHLPTSLSGRVEVAAKELVLATIAKDSDKKIHLSRQRIWYSAPENNLQVESFTPANLIINNALYGVHRILVGGNAP